MRAAPGPNRLAVAWRRVATGRTRRLPLTHGVVLREGGRAVVATPDRERRPIVATVTLTAPDGGKVSWVVAFTDAADAA